MEDIWSTLGTLDNHEDAVYKGAVELIMVRKSQMLSISPFAWDYLKDVILPTLILESRIIQHENWSSDHRGEDDSSWETFMEERDENDLFHRYDAKTTINMFLYYYSERIPEDRVNMNTIILVGNLTIQNMIIILSLTNNEHEIYVNTADFFETYFEAHVKAVYNIDLSYYENEYTALAMNMFKYNIIPRIIHFMIINDIKFTELQSRILVWIYTHVLASDWIITSAGKLRRFTQTLEQVRKITLKNMKGWLLSANPKYLIGFTQDMELDVMRLLRQGLRVEEIIRLSRVARSR